MYLLSDGISFLLYAVIRYRRQVVENNLLIAFPEKTEAERKKIERQFYINFTDNWFEVIKMISISQRELTKRFTGNFNILNELCESGINTQVHLGHYFNWEYANLAYSRSAVCPFLVVYKPISSKIIDRIFQKIRTRFGSVMVASNNFRRDFAPYAKKCFALVLVADQSEFPERAYWVPFFGKMATFVQGPERTARMNNSAILMARFKKIKRGYYQSELVLLTKEAGKLPKGDITKLMTAFIEAHVREEPANYLWSHRRWKWQWDEDKYKAL